MKMEEVLPHKPRINAISLCTALILFLFPWTEVTCNGTVMATQTGFQAVYGGMSAQGQTTLPDDKTDKNDIGMAFFVTLALLAVIGGAAIAVMIVMKKDAPPVKPGLLAATALVLILLQWMLGFPVNKALRKETGQETQMLSNEIKVEAKRTGWFYVTLLALLAPAALFVYERRMGGGSSPAASTAQPPAA